MTQAERTLTTNRGAAHAPLEVAIIGAGIAGIGMAIRLRAAGIEDFRIFEKTQGVGGTWWDNTYPGAACDIPSHLYSYSFELDPDWSRVYSGQTEIRAYVERCVAKYGIGPHVEHGTEIVAAVFDEAAARWRIRTRDGREIVARFLVSAVGALNRPQIPDIPGLGEFPGRVFHSARWDHDHDMNGRRVAMIGSAASAVQIAPEIAPQVARLTIFQRTPNYIVPRLDRAYSEREKARFRRHPWRMKLHRLRIFLAQEYRHLLFRKGSWMGKQAAKLAIRHMRGQVRDPALQEKLVPDYPLGCKRILISDDFYPTLNRDNVALVTARIARISPEGVVTLDGATHPADTIILATGFRATDFLETLELTGRNGRSLREAWSARMEAHRGTMVAGFPNFFILLGPNTGLGHNSIIYMIEQQLDYVMQCLARLGDGRYIDARPAAQRAWNDRLHADLADTVWAGSCASWYKLPDGTIPTLWPHRAHAFARALRRLDPAEFEIVGA